MILIISTEFDQNTTSTINWLIYKKIPFVRINETDFIEDIILSPEDVSFFIKNQYISVSRISACWYRRGALLFKNDLFTLQKNLLNTEFVNIVGTFKKREIGKCIEYIYSSLSSKKKSIGDFYNTDLNKLIVLQKAREVGLLIPDSYVLTKRDDLLNLPTKELITKPISEVIDYHDKNIEIKLYTQTIEETEKLSTDFFYSFVQAQIKKKYELRSFYLAEHFYSMCIFSQNDDQTKVDFRQYNNRRPNRNVPYKLPASIERKLDLLMKKLNLNSGSIDLIVDQNDDFYFLEINPVGQFGMVSYPCNYYLEKTVATYLYSATS